MCVGCLCWAPSAAHTCGAGEAADSDLSLSRAPRFLSTPALGSAWTQGMTWLSHNALHVASTQGHVRELALLSALSATRGTWQELQIHQPSAWTRGAFLLWTKSLTLLRGAGALPRGLWGGVLGQLGPGAVQGPHLRGSWFPGSLCSWHSRVPPGVLLADTICALQVVDPPPPQHTEVEEVPWT